MRKPCTVEKCAQKQFRLVASCVSEQGRNGELECYLHFGKNLFCMKVTYNNLFFQVPKFQAATIYEGVFQSSPFFGTSNSPRRWLLQTFELALRAKTTDSRLPCGAHEKYVRRSPREACKKAPLSAQHTVFRGIPLSSSLTHQLNWSKLSRSNVWSSLLRLQ